MPAVGIPGLERSLDIRPVQAAFSIRLLQLFHPSPLAPNSSLIQPHLIRKNNKSQKFNAFFDLTQTALAGIELQPQTEQKFDNSRPQVCQQVFIIMKAAKVIHITQIAFDPQLIFDEVIKCIEIHIGKKLAGQIPNRNPTPAYQRGKQLILMTLLINAPLPVGCALRTEKWVQRLPPTGLRMPV